MIVSFNSFAEMLTALKRMLRDNDIEVNDIDYVHNTLSVDGDKTKIGALRDAVMDGE